MNKIWLKKNHIHLLFDQRVKILTFKQLDLIFYNNSQFHLEIYLIFEINLNFNFITQVVYVPRIFFIFYSVLKSNIYGYKISDSTNVKLSSEIEKSHWIECKDLKCAFFLQILGAVLISRRLRGFLSVLVSSKICHDDKLICSRG